MGNCKHCFKRKILPLALQMDDVLNDDEFVDGPEGELCPPAEEFESPLEWTAGPMGSGGHCYGPRVWKSLTTSSRHTQTADALHLLTSPDGELRCLGGKSREGRGGGGLK